MKVLFTIILFILTQISVAQITFEKVLGGISSDDAKGVVQCPDSGYAVLARTWSWGHGGSDLLLIRMDKYGDTLWTKLYGGTSNEFTNGAIKITLDGGFIIAGNTYSFGSGTPASFNWYLIKTDANGNVTWTRTWGATGNDELKHVIPTSDGNYLLSGAWMVSGVSKGIILKVDSVGNTLWGDTLLSSATSHFMYACENAQHEYITVGYTFAGDFNAVIRKYDTIGNLLVNKMYDYGLAEAGITIEPLPAGGYICSATYGISFSYDPWILKLDENLDTLFSRVMDFTYSIAGFSAKEYSIYPAGSGFIICGADSNRLMLRKTDASLNTVWEQLYGGLMGEAGYEGIPTSDGGFIAAGLTFSYGAGSADCYIIKADSLGMQSVPVGITSKENESILIYPNPANSNLFIENFQQANIDIFNSQGQLIITLWALNEKKSLDISGYAKGIYIVKVLTEKEVTFRKFVKE